MIFKSLMVAGCLAALQSDFASLSPAMPQLPTATAVMSVVHLLRKLVLALTTPTPDPDPGPDPDPDPNPNPNPNYLAEQLGDLASECGTTVEEVRRLYTWLGLGFGLRF